MTQQLCDSEFPWCPSDARAGEFYKLRVKDLSPTQFAVGKAEVTGRMRKKFNKDPGKLHDYLRVRPVPVLVRGKTFYLVDHHHLVRALYDALHKKRGKDICVYVKVWAMPAHWRKPISGRPCTSITGYTCSTVPVAVRSNRPPSPPTSRILISIPTGAWPGLSVNTTVT